VNSLDNIYEAVDTRSFNITDIIFHMCQNIHKGQLSKARTIIQEEIRIPLNRPDAKMAVLPITEAEYKYLRHIERYNPEVTMLIFDSPEFKVIK